MTREEAIEQLRNLSQANFYPRTIMALDMAIEALQDLSKPNNRSQGSDDNMTGITEGSYTGFCKNQLITCSRVKECNGACPFEDALKHADQTQTMNEQHIINHDRDWIIGCIQHDGFIHTHRFDKANQIILEALSADAVEVVRCKDCKHYLNEHICMYFSRHGTIETSSYAYCSYAERREP